MVLLIIIPFLNGYFIGNINPTFSGPNPCQAAEEFDLCNARADPWADAVPSSRRNSDTKNWAEWADEFSWEIAHYPLVNVYITMERSTMFNG